MMLLTAVTFGGQEAAVPVLAHLPEDEAALLRHRAEKLLEIPRERRVPLLVQEIKKLVTARRTHLWSAEPEALARMLEQERPALRELILRTLPVALADAVRLHLPAVAVEVREEVSAGVLGVIRWKLEGLLQEASAGTLWKFSDLLMLKPRELYTLADRQGCRALATAFAALLAEEQAQLLGTLPPEISQLAQRAISAAAGRELSQADARALLTQHGVESSPLEGIRSAGIQRIARACLAQGPEFAARLLERHRPPFAPVFQKWMNDERTRAAARGDGGRTEVVADLERLEARGLVEKPSRLPAMSRKPVVPPPAAAARPPPAAARPSPHAGAFSPIAPRPPQSGPQPAQGARPEVPARADTPPVPPPAAVPGAVRPRPRDPSGDATWEAPPGPLDPRVATSVKRAGLRPEAPAPMPPPAPEQEALHSDFPATPMPPPPRTSSLRPAHEMAEGSPPRRVEAPGLDRRPVTGPMRGEFRPAHEQGPRGGAEGAEEGLDPGPTSPQRPGRVRPPPDATPSPVERPVPEEDEATQAIHMPRPPREGERRASGSSDRAGAEPGAAAARDGGERPGPVAPGRGVRVGGAAEDPSTAPRPRLSNSGAGTEEVARTVLPRASRDGGRSVARTGEEVSGPARGPLDRSGVGEGHPRAPRTAGDVELPRSDSVARPSRDGQRSSPGRGAEPGAARSSERPLARRTDGASPAAAKPLTEPVPRSAREGGRPAAGRPETDAEAPGAAVPRGTRQGGRPLVDRSAPGADEPGTQAVPRLARASGRPVSRRPGGVPDGPGMEEEPRDPRDGGRPVAGRAAGSHPVDRAVRGGNGAGSGRVPGGASEPRTEAGPRVSREGGQPVPVQSAGGRDGPEGGRAGGSGRIGSSWRVDGADGEPGTEAFLRVSREGGRPVSARPAEGTPDAAGRARAGSGRADREGDEPGTEGARPAPRRAGVSERVEGVPRPGREDLRGRSAAVEPETEPRTQTVPRLPRGLGSEDAGPVRRPPERPLAPPPPLRPSGLAADEEPETTSAVAFQGGGPAARRPPGPVAPSEGDATQDLSGVLAAKGASAPDVADPTEEIPRQVRRASPTQGGGREAAPAAGALRRQGPVLSREGEEASSGPAGPPVRDPVAARAARRAGALSAGSPVVPADPAAPLTAPAPPSQRRPPVAVATRVPQRRRADSRIRKAVPAASAPPAAPVDAPAPPSRSPRVVATVPRRKAVRGPGRGPDGGSD
jgi:hypothetical protein